MAFGDVACWLAWQLSDGGHVSEPSNACRTLLVDLERLSWDDGLLRLFGVPAALLPEIRPSDGSRLGTASRLGFEAPIAAMLGDQPAALFGQGCRRPRMAALTNVAPGAKIASARSTESGAAVMVSIARLASSAAC